MSWGLLLAKATCLSLVSIGGLIDEIKFKNFPIQPNGLFKQLRQVLPKNSAITLDAGTLCLQATDALEYYDPPSLFTPLDFGLVGFSFACGLGVKVAKPNKKVISLMGCLLYTSPSPRD